MSFTTSATKGTLVKTLSSDEINEQVNFNNSNNVFRGTLSGSTIEDSVFKGTLSGATGVFQGTLSGVSILNYDRIENTGTGSPVIASNSTITLSATDTVVVKNAPLRLASFTTGERDNLTSLNGDLILNISTNKVQARVSGTWVDLH